MMASVKAKEHLADLSSLGLPQSSIVPPAAGQSRRTFVASFFASAPSTPTLRPQIALHASTLLSDYLRRILDTKELRDMVWFREFCKLQTTAGDDIRDRPMSSPFAMVISNAAPPEKFSPGLRFNPGFGSWMYGKSVFSER